MTKQSRSAASPDLDVQRQETARREIAYFTTHIQHTRYGYFRSQEYFIGSGVIEAGRKAAIGRRLKQSEIAMANFDFVDYKNE